MRGAQEGRYKEAGNAAWNFFVIFWWFFEAQSESLWIVGKRGRLGPLLRLGTHNNGRESALFFHCSLEHFTTLNFDLIKKSNKALRSWKMLRTMKLSSFLLNKGPHTSIYSESDLRMKSHHPHLSPSTIDNVPQAALPYHQNPTTKYGPHKMQSSSRTHTLPFLADNTRWEISPFPWNQSIQQRTAHGLGRAVPVQILLPRVLHRRPTHHARMGCSWYFRRPRRLIPLSQRKKKEKKRSGKKDRVNTRGFFAFGLLLFFFLSEERQEGVMH